MMYMKRFLKLLLEKSRHDLEFVFYFQLLPDSSFEKGVRSISIMSKLTLIIIDFVFHSYYASHLRLMFYVLCKYIQLNHFQFVPFYALKNLFPSLLPSNCLLVHAEDVTRHMASLPSPNSFKSERSYDHGVLNLIDDKEIKCLD